MRWKSENRSARGLALILGAILLLTLWIGPSVARAGRSQGAFTSFETSKLTKPKKVGVLHSVVELHADIDRTRPINYLCVYSAHNAQQNGQLANVKAGYRTQARILDHRTGTFETHEVDSGTMKTGLSGWVRTMIPIPAAVQAAIFADGFESGDLSVLLMTQAVPTKGKRLVQTQFRCDLLEE